MARILITGASGLLGANLALEARARHYDVIGLYGQHPVAFEGILTEPVDLTNAKAIQQCVEKHAPDGIVHCAALTNVDWCEDNPQKTRLIHVEATHTLAEVARKTRTHLVYISTDSVYGGKHELSSETDSTEPVNYYAQTKLEGERVVQESLPDALIARTTIYGWNVQPKHCLAEWILSKLETKTPFDGYDDTRFSPILVNDLAEILFAAMEHRLAGVYNMGGGEACSKYEFALNLAEVFDLDNTLIRRTNITDAAFSARRPHNTSMNMEKLCKALNMNLPDVMTGLRRFKTLRDTGYVATLKKACKA